MGLKLVNSINRDLNFPTQRKGKDKKGGFQCKDEREREREREGLDFSHSLTGEDRSKQKMGFGG